MGPCAECGRPTNDRWFVAHHWLCAVHRRQRGVDFVRGLYGLHCLHGPHGPHGLHGPHGPHGLHGPHGPHGLPSGAASLPAAGAAGAAPLAASVVREVDLLRALVFDFPVVCAPREALARARFAARACAGDDRVRIVVRAYRIRQTLVLPGLERAEAADFFERLVLFMCTWVPSVHALAASAVERWYPLLAGSHTLATIARAERVLFAVQRATGARAFFVMSDLLPLRALMPRELLDMVYLAYIWHIGR